MNIQFMSFVTTVVKKMLLKVLNRNRRIIMPLIKCPECQQEISDTAKSCPNCGYAIKQQEFYKVQ